MNKELLVLRILKLRIVQLNLRVAQVEKKASTANTSGYRTINSEAKGYAKNGRN